MSDRNDVVIINLDRPREIRFGHKALKTLFATIGKSLEEVNDEDFVKEMEPIMYCGLLSDARKNNETLKLEDMEDLLDLAPYHEVISKMQEAMNLAFGQFGDDEKNSKGIVESKKKTKK